MTSSIFPTLYVNVEVGKGRQKFWKVWTDGDKFYKQDCFVGGKEKQPTCRQCKATNVGKSNERSSTDQAKFEAAKAWVKILDKGYKPAPDDEAGMKVYNYIAQFKNNGDTSHGLPLVLIDLVEGKDVCPSASSSKSVVVTMKPMLAERLQDKERQFKPQQEEWFMQPKLDGVRCLAKLDDSNNVVLISRTGKQFGHLNHIRKELSDLFMTGSELVLDGELFTRHLTVNGKEMPANKMFALITGACRPTRNQPAEYEKQIQYHVYDVIDAGCRKTQSDRVKFLLQLKDKQNPVSCIQIVETLPVKSMSEVKDYQTKVLALGYEGVMLRKGETTYQQKRTTSLLKFKLFQDEEYEIVGAKEGDGTEFGCVVWRCVTPDGKEFDVRPRGSFEERRKLFEQWQRYKGKQLTVRFQDLSADGIPRFPVGITIRDYE